MAEDLNLDIALQLTPASLRAIQSDINDSIRSLNPRLNVDLKNIQDLATKGIDLKVNLLPFLNSVKVLRKSIEDALEVRINEVSVSRNALNKIENEIRKTFSDIQILENPRMAPGVKPKGTFSSVSDIEAPEVDSQANALEAARKKLTDLILARADLAEKLRKAEEESLSAIEKVNAEIIKRNKSSFFAQRSSFQEEDSKIESRARQELDRREKKPFLSQEFERIDRKILEKAQKRLQEFDSSEESRIGKELVASKARHLQFVRQQEEQAKRQREDAALDAQMDGYIKALKKRNDAVNKELLDIQDRNDRLAYNMDAFIEKIKENRKKEDRSRVRQLLKEYENNQKNLNKTLQDAENQKKHEAKVNRQLIDIQEKVDKKNAAERAKAIEEGIAITKKVNETNRIIRARNEALVSVIDSQLRAGVLNIKKEPASLGNVLSSAINSAAGKIFGISNSADELGKNIANDGIKLTSQLRAQRLANLKDSLQKMHIELSKAADDITKLRTKLTIGETRGDSSRAQELIQKQLNDALDRQKTIELSILNRKKIIDKLTYDISRAQSERLKNETLNSNTNAANSFLTENINKASGKIADVAKKVPSLSRAFSLGGSLIINEVRQIRLGSLRNSAADLQKQLVKATNEVAKAKFARDKAAATGESPERQRKLSNELLDAIMRQREIERNINKTKREINSLTSEIQKALRDRLANEQEAARAAAKEALRGRKTSTGPSRKGNDVTFRGIGDIENFGRQLDPRSMERFADIVQRGTLGTRSAIQIQKEFASAIQKSNGPISRIKDNLNSGTKAAFEFGERSFDAAQRLLAWAAPATFIFSTISALKDATRQLVDLDTQARRLVFFENADFIDKGIVGAKNIDFSSISKSVQESRNNIDLFINSSKELGISIEDVVEATVTASRVGQKLTDTVTKLDGSTDKVRSTFLNTVIELVRLEGGALKAEDAVNSLNAISIQFFDKLKRSIDDVDVDGFSETLSTGLASAGSLLAVVAAKSAFSVRELADATARVGAAFANIQGTGLPQVISLIGEASSATGANVGRLSTALRQILTFSVQNAEKLKESFNIEIIDAEGGVAGFNKVLEVLRKINELQGTEKAVELAKLIGDRRNVADIQSLAVAVGKLESQFGHLNDEEVEVAIVQNAVEQQLKQNVLAADSMAATTAKLRAEVLSLANNANLGEFVKTFTRGLTGGVEIANSLIDSLSKVTPLLQGIATFALATLAPKIGAGIAGFLGSSLSSATRLAVKEQTASAIQREENLIRAVNQAEKDGLLTANQAKGARLAQVKIMQQQANIENHILKTQTLIDAERKKSVVDLEKIKRLEGQIEQLMSRQEAISRRQSSLRNTAQQQVLNTSSFSQLTRGNAIAGIGTAAALAATLFGEKFAFAITEDEKMSRGISDALNAAVSSGTVGAALGSVIPGIGTVVGALVGVLSGAAVSIYSSVIGQTAAQLEEQTQTLEARRKAILAGIAQREIIRARKLQEVEAKDERVRVQQEINQLQNKSADIYERLSNAGQNETSIQFLKNEALRIEEQIRQKNLQLREEELKIEKDKLALEERAAQIKRDEQVSLNRISNAQRAINSMLSERAKSELGLTLNRTKLETEVESIQKRIQNLVEKRELSVRLGASDSELGKLAQEIADLQAEANNKRGEILGEEIATQEKILEITSTRTKEQVDAWEESSKKVVSAFEAIVKLQNEAATHFFERGKSLSDVLSSNFKELSSLLEESGASIVERLRAARDIQDRRLAAVQGGAAQAISRIRSGPIRPFGSTQELRAEAERVASIVAEANIRSNQKVFDEETKLVNDRLAILRTEAENSRNLFELRLNQTKQEIDLRKKVAEEEISILRERQQIERQLNAERIKQQREFGRLIIEGPEQFLAVAKDIRNARSFFNDITDVSIDSLRRISSRAERARQGGQFGNLQSVLRGLEAAQRFGRPDIIGGVSNSQLQSIFERIQVVLPEDIEKDLKRQQQELNNQTNLQKQIELRQRQQEALLQAEAALTEAQLRINISAQDTAIKQRDALIKLMESSIKQQNKDTIALYKLQESAFRALLHVNADNNGELNKLLVEFQKGVTEGQTDAFFEAENERLAISNGVLQNANTSLADVINNASKSVGLFNSKLLEINGIQERFSSTLSGTALATTGSSTNQTISGNGAEAINRIEELVSRNARGGISIGRSREFLELEAATRGGRGSREQRARLEELKKQEIRPRSFGSTQQRDVARVLLQDQKIRDGLEDGFRGLLQRGVGGDSELVRQLKEARGIGQAGARNIDPERVREILSRSGLSGLARDVDSRGEAAQLVDKLLRFSEELSKTPDKLSERAVGILKEILATELKEGFREVAQVIQARRHPISEEEKNAANAASTRLNIFNPDDAVEFANKFNEAVKEQFDERARYFVNTAVAGFEGAIRAAIQNNTIKVELPALDIELRSTVTNVLAGDSFLNNLQEILTKNGLSEEMARELREKVKKIATVMVNNGQLPPELD